VVGAGGGRVQAEQQVRRGGQVAAGPVGLEQQRRGVPGVGPAQQPLPGPGLLRALLDLTEHCRRQRPDVQPAQGGVQRRQHRRRRLGQCLRDSAQHVAQLRHHRGGVLVVAGDVPDDQRGVPVLGDERVVPVPTDLGVGSRRLVAHRNLQTVRLRRGGQQTALQRLRQPPAHPGGLPLGPLRQDPVQRLPGQRRQRLQQLPVGRPPVVPAGGRHRQRPEHCAAGAQRHRRRPLRPGPLVQLGCAREQRQGGRPVGQEVRGAGLRGVHHRQREAERQHRHLSLHVLVQEAGRAQRPDLLGVRLGEDRPAERDIGSTSIAGRWALGKSELVGTRTRCTSEAWLTGS
jgi:hypothetical protein